MLNVLTKKLELDEQNARLVVPKSIQLRQEFVGALGAHEQWAKFELPTLNAETEKAIKSVSIVLRYR